jgi:hypothetical protein
VGGIVAIIQQGRVLRQDEEEMEAIADDKNNVIEGEVVTRTTGSKNKKTKSPKASAKKRRK